MRLEEYRKKLKEDHEFVDAKKELQPFINLGNNILDLRMRKGWSQKELAEKIGTKQANISKIEAAISNPSLKFINKIAKAFDIEVSKLFIDQFDYKQSLIGIEKVEANAIDDVDSIAIPVLNWPGKPENIENNYPKFSAANERKVNDV